VSDFSKAKDIINLSKEFDPKLIKIISNKVMFLKGVKASDIRYLCK
jgi:hypothetical protein